MTTVLETIGDGLWSNVSKQVRITDIQLVYVNEERDFGDLHVYFNTDDWNVKKDGLIYTDSLFLKELGRFLISQDLDDSLGYNEQGMQGRDYVSLSVKEDFIKAWDEKYKPNVDDSCL